MKQLQLAAAIGKSLSTVRNWENDRSPISDGDLLLIGRTLSINTDWLKTGEGNMHALYAPIEPEGEYEEEASQLTGKT